MVYVVARWWYPSHKQEEVGKIYQKRLKDGPSEDFVPGIGEVAVAGAIKGSKEGFMGMAFTKVAPEQIAQAITNSGTILSLYNNVEGYEWNIETWADITDVPAE